VRTEPTGKGGANRFGQFETRAERNTQPKTNEYRGRGRVKKKRENPIGIDKKRGSFKFNGSGKQAKKVAGKVGGPTPL